MVGKKLPDGAGPAVAVNQHCLLVGSPQMEFSNRCLRPFLQLKCSHSPLGTPSAKAPMRNLAQGWRAIRSRFGGQWAGFQGLLWCTCHAGPVRSRHLRRIAAVSSGFSLARAPQPGRRIPRYWLYGDSAVTTLLPRPREGDAPRRPRDRRSACLSVRKERPRVRRSTRYLRSWLSAGAPASGRTTRRECGSRSPIPERRSRSRDAPLRSRWREFR